MEYLGFLDLLVSKQPENHSITVIGGLRKCCQSKWYVIVGKAQVENHSITVLGSLYECCQSVVMSLLVKYN